MDIRLLAVLAVSFLIGAYIGNIIVKRYFSKVRAYRFFNRIHRYIYVPLFRKRWDAFDQEWYDEWEKAKAP